MIPLRSNKSFHASHGMTNLAMFNDYFQSTLDETNADPNQKDDFEEICQRLNLAKGEKLLDIGCEMTVYAAKNFGVNVLGVTVNKSVQTRLNQVIAGLGLPGSAVKLMDYRNLIGVKFDKAVCLDPSAIVRQKETVTLFGTIYNLLYPGGLFLIQCLAPPPVTWAASIEPQTWLARCFGLILRLSSQEHLPTFQMVDLIARKIGFNLQLVDDLSETYRLRLQYWLSYLQIYHNIVIGDTSETIFHDWNVNLSILLNRIESGDVHFFQYLLSKPENAPDHVSIPDSQRCCGLRDSE